MMALGQYIARIGYDGPLRPDLETLIGLHRAHLLAIPYENIDVQLGRPVVTDPAAAFERIVDRSRGGWCYEMNGLFGWALGEIGFDVTRMAGGVMREMAGDEQAGNHLVLRVDLADGPQIADVGFGDGPIEPYPLRPGIFVQEGFEFELFHLEDGWWRLRNHPMGGARSFDFRSAPADEDLLKRKCEQLQSRETSIFVQNLICQRPTGNTIHQLRGRVLRTLRHDGFDERLIEDLAEFEAMMASVFGLTDPEMPRLWDKVSDRHRQIFP